MPMGDNQQNGILQIIIDVWEDKIFFNGNEYPAGYFAAGILNVSDNFIVTSITKAHDLMMLIPFVHAAGKEELKKLLPELNKLVTGIIEDLATVEPFSLWNIKDELLIPEVMLSEETLNDLLNPGEGRSFFMRYLTSAVAVPFAVYHFVDAVRVLECNCLHQLPKRNETYFAMGVHDTFNHPEFKKILSDTLVPEVEPFVYFPAMQSLYCFARDPKRYGEMIFVNRLLFKNYMDFFVYDLLNGMHHGHAPRKCECCGKYFLTLDAHRPKYCDGMAPQNPHYSCRQYGAMNQQKEKNANHPIFQIFKTRTSTIRKHYQRGKITDAERQEAMQICEELRDRALFDTQFAQGEYVRLMEQDAVYEEVRRQLGGPHDK